MKQKEKSHKNMRECLLGFSGEILLKNIYISLVHKNANLYDDGAEDMKWFF